MSGRSIDVIKFNLRLLMKLCGVLLCGLLTLSCVAGAEERELNFAEQSSIPPNVIDAFKKSQLTDKYTFSSRVNPFFIQGDFNGDGKLDCAILVKQKASGKIGIAIVHGGSNSVKLLGAGLNFGNGGDDFSWMDAWYAYAKGPTYQGASDGSPPKLRGDALMLMKTESASALAYWTGKRYVWFQQDD